MRPFVILASLAAVALSGCMTTQGGTLGQRLFEARADFVAVKGLAVDIAEQSSTPKSVVEFIAEVRDQAKPAVDAVDAYGACSGRSQGVVVLEGKPEPIDCSTFNFSSQSLSATINQLRSLTLKLKAKLGRS